MSTESFWKRPLHADTEVIGRKIFGSPKKLALGIWIVERSLAEPFSVEEAMAAHTGSKFNRDSHIGVYLKEWSSPEIAMLERLHEPQTSHQRYLRTDSKLWGIFEAAKLAVELNDQSP